MLKHIVSFSGGSGSWGAAKRVASEITETDTLTLLFSDTIIEDQDTYRFVIEGAANVLGKPCPVPLLKVARELPELSLDDPYCIERKAILSTLRASTMEVLPGLVWIAEGRHPWEVFEDRRFIGNSRVDPCSKLLKRKLLDSWVHTNCNPDSTIRYVGIDWSEKHRLDRMLPLVAPWKFEAPLCKPPLLTKAAVLSWMQTEEIQPPRSYALGFPHNNCGGFCCKAGQAHFSLLHRVHAGRFAWHEWWENRLRELVGNYSIMKDRRGGTKKPLTMSELRKRIEEGEDFGQDGWGGCGCALEQ